MADFGTLKSQIASDLKRSDLASDIATAVLASIRDYSTERFWFNETRSYTLTLSDGVDEYSITEVAPVSEFVKIDWVRVQVGSTWWRLDRVGSDEMEELHSTVTEGEPQYWTYYGDMVRFYPTPGQTYTARIAGHYRLVELSADTDRNAWTNVAKDLIRYSALRRLFAFPVRNIDAAQGAGIMEKDQLVYLRRETDRRKRKGVMAPYYG